MAAPNADNETFMVYVAVLAESTIMLIHPFCQAQVSMLTSEEIGIPAKYSEFPNVFSSDSAAELPEYTRINDYPINLLDDKQRPEA